jgi:orotate phosphoribosyltransferase
MENKSSKIAEYLLKIKAVKLNTVQPFTWTSGLKSPIYCDNRLILSYPDIRRSVKMALVSLIREKFPDANAIAAVATAGIAHGAMIADEMGLPFLYVRGDAKGHGLRNRIEGRVEPDRSYVVVEDLISTGASSLSVIQALREAGASVTGTVSIFSYDFPQAAEGFSNIGVACHPLTNLQQLLDKAVEMAYLAPADIETILEWRKSPVAWGE